MSKQPRSPGLFLFIPQALTGIVYLTNAKTLSPVRLPFSSERHLDRYVDEFAFRCNHRKMSDAQRTVSALKKVGGKRLTYKETKKPKDI